MHILKTVGYRSLYKPVIFLYISHRKLEFEIKKKKFAITPKIKYVENYLSDEHYPLMKGFNVDLKKRTALLYSRTGRPSINSINSPQFLSRLNAIPADFFFFLSVFFFCLFVLSL